MLLPLGSNIFQHFLTGIVGTSKPGIVKNQYRGVSWVSSIGTTLVERFTFPR